MLTELPIREDVQRLFLQHASALRGFILGLLPDFDQAEDVLQEVFVTVSEKAGEFQSGTGFYAWACAIARRKVLEHCRRNRRLLALRDPRVFEAVANAAEEVEGRWDLRRRALSRCLEKLTPRTRELIALRYEMGLLPAQIAGRISWSLGAVQVALSRGRGFLRACAKRQLGER